MHTFNLTKKERSVLAAAVNSKSKSVERRKKSGGPFDRLVQLRLLSPAGKLTRLGADVHRELEEG